MHGFAGDAGRCRKMREKRGGAMVIGIISNGLNLIGVSSYWQLIVKGLIIACAVVLDSQKGNLALLRKKK